jgi:hypothetical protein
MNAIRLGAMAVLAATVAGIACQNSGEGRVLGIDATGAVVGVVFFDRNGNRVLDGADTILSNLPVRLVAAGTHDTTARANSGASGTFAMLGVPVGTYNVAVDTVLAGDSIRVTRIDTSVVTLRPRDTLTVRIAVSFPQLSIPEFRALVPGKKAFVVGVALNPRGVFGDTTFNLADPNTAIRLTNVRTAIVGTGDSVRVLGGRSSRDGQPVLDRATIFPLATDAVVPLHELNSATAATAQGGALDAALVRVMNARIMDTASLGDARQLHVDDTSGLLEVRLDTLVGFRGSALAGDTVGARFDFVGLLVPTGSGGWRLRPRTTSDLVKR